MKKTILLTAVLLSSSFAQAQDRSIGERALPEFLQQFDTNEDGRLDAEERQAIRDFRLSNREERRNSLDLDGDGTISPEEIEAAREAIRERINRRRNSRFLEAAGEDELLSPEEFANLPGIQFLPEEMRDALFARLDVDENGSVDIDEFYHRLRRHEAPSEGNPDDNQDGDSTGTSFTLSGEGWEYSYSGSTELSPEVVEELTALITSLASDEDLLSSADYRAIREAIAAAVRAASASE